MKKQHVTLNEADKAYLEKLVSRGELPVKLYRRAVGLLELHRGQSYQAVSATLGVNPNTVSTWAKRYKQEQLAFLHDKLRLGRPVEIDEHQRAKIIALACSDAPAGYNQWSLRLLADKVVELGYCDQISHSTIRTILKKQTQASADKT